METMYTMESMIYMVRSDTTIPVSKETRKKVLSSLLEEQIECSKHLTYDEFILILLRRSKACKKL